MIAIKEHITNNSIENDYSKSISLAHRKKFAQFFTPFPIADFMAKWILGNENLKNVLDPAFGLGVFSRAILSRKENVSIKGFEVDSKIYEKAISNFEDCENVSIQLEDYMYNDWDNKYDGIICNPPYFKFHDYDNKNILKEIEENLKCKLNGFTNLYTLFLLKSIHQLNKNGRCAFIIPSEFLNSDYGKLVKSYLIKSKTLRHIIIIDFDESVFDDALTTASIFLCANDNKADKVQFSNVQSIQNLEQIGEIISSYPDYVNSNQVYGFSELNPDIKWKAYYQKQNSIKFKHLAPFSNYAKVVRGIATGSNDFFTFSKSKATQFSIKEKFLLPCICKAIDSRNPFFTQSDFERLKANDKSIYLLDAIDSPDEAIKNYLKKGELEGIDKKFLTASRNPWYSLENRLPSPIWVSVFNRTGLRFIRNEANISNLTTFHCIYPKQTNLFTKINIDLLFAYLLTDVAKQIFEDNCREYGNGLQKFEPNDINKGKMLNLEVIDDKTKEEILKLYINYRNEVLGNRISEQYLSKMNDIFVSYFT